MGGSNAMHALSDYLICIVPRLSCVRERDYSLVDSSSYLANALQTFSIRIPTVHQYKTSTKSLMSGDPDI